MAYHQLNNGGYIGEINEEIAKQINENISTILKKEKETIKKYLNFFNKCKKEIDALTKTDLHVRTISESYNSASFNDGTNEISNINAYAMQKVDASKQMELFKVMLKAQTGLEAFREWLTGETMHINIRMQTGKSNAKDQKRSVVMPMMTLLTGKDSTNILGNIDKLLDNLKNDDLFNWENIKKTFVSDLSKTAQGVVLQLDASKGGKNLSEFFFNEKTNLYNNYNVSKDLYNNIWNILYTFQEEYKVPDWRLNEIYGYLVTVAHAQDMSNIDIKLEFDRMVQRKFDFDANYKRGDEVSNIESKNLISGSANAAFKLSTILTQIHVIQQAFANYSQNGDSKLQTMHELHKLWFNTEDAKTLRENAEEHINKQIFSQFK